MTTLKKNGNKNIKIYDGTGAVVANYNYDAWGNVISVTDANGAAITDSTHIANVNPLRYRGYYYDSEISSVTAMVFAPASIGANFVVNSAFSGVGTAGATGFIAQFAVNFAMGGNISILQSIIDLF